MPRTAQPRPADLTGKIKAEQEAQHAEERKQRASQMAMVNAVEEVENSEPVDYTQPKQPSTPPKAEVQDVEVKNPTRRIRVNTQLEQVTIGAGTSYDFEVGREYVVPRQVAEHLEEKGYIWH